MMHVLFALLAIGIVAMALLGIFKNSLYNRLSTRIIALIFVSGLVALAVSFVLGESINSNARLRWHLLPTALVVLGGPVALGLLTARFVRRPLHQFNAAVASLEQNNYTVRLEPTGIREFDEVFTKFNDLISRLHHEEKLRKNLVSDASHELNTPLTTMIGQLTAMQEGKYALTKERVVMLKEQAERLADLVRQLDAYTKARLTDTSASETMPLRPFCEEFIRQFSLELRQKGIHTKLIIPENYMIRADRQALRQILTNLMQNALRYSDATETTITATAQTLSFSDNGKGVPADSLPYLFERFYRVDTSRGRATGGLGLGLAIVRELAEGQDWSIRAVAGHPGLTFVLQIEQ